jgi:hypothetical protein
MWISFTVVLLAAHLLAMNVAAAGPLAWAWLVGRRGDGRRLELARRIASRSLLALGVGIAIGAALLAAPNPELRAALRRFPASAYWFAAAELAFSAGWMAVMLFAGRRFQGRPWLAWFVAIASASNLIYHFPPWMAVIGRLAVDPSWAADEVIPRAALLRLAARPEILALWMHFVLAAFAGAAIAALWPVRGAEADVADTSPWRPLAAAALVASLLQLPVGVWLTATSSPAMRDALLGGELYASACFLAGVLAALWLMHTLALIALGDATPAMRRRAGWSLVVVALLMTATLVTGRRTLKPGSSLGARSPSASDAQTTPALTATRPAPPVLP